MERETNQSLSTGVGLKHRGGRGIYILLFLLFYFFFGKGESTANVARARACGATDHISQAHSIG